MYMKTSLEPLAALIKKAQHRQNRMMEASLHHLGISLVQWNALREIDRNPGCSQHRLAELTFNSDQAFGTLITRLQRLGLVKRRPGAGRAIVVQLTAEGKSLLRQGAPHIVDVCATSFAALTDHDRDVLAALMLKLLSPDDTLLVDENDNGDSNPHLTLPSSPTKMKRCGKRRESIGKGHWSPRGGHKKPRLSLLHTRAQRVRASH